MTRVEAESPQEIWIIIQTFLKVRSYIDDRQATRSGE